MWPVQAYLHQQGRVAAAKGTSVYNARRDAHED